MNTIPFQPGSDLLAVMDKVNACALRAQGLLHLLAIAAVHSTTDPACPPDSSAADGILWLSMKTGDDLHAACSDAFSATAARSKQPTVAASGTSHKGGGL